MFLPDIALPALLATLLVAVGCQRDSSRETPAGVVSAVTAPPSAPMASGAASAERLAAGGRLARKKKASATLPHAELDALERAAESFFDARESSEVDLSGTLRAAFRIEERARLEDAFVSALERVSDAGFPEKTPDPRAIEAEHDAVYLRLIKCPRIAATRPGAITLNAVRNTERLWLSYRDAWVALGTRVRPDSSPDLWRSWATRERTTMLRELATGC